MQVDLTLLKQGHYHSIKDPCLRITINSALNLTFSEWGKIFDSTTVATAIADRLVYNSEILIMEGKVIERGQGRTTKKIRQLFLYPYPGVLHVQELFNKKILQLLV